MKKTIAELNALVAELREPKPLKCLFSSVAMSESGEWILKWSWEVESWAWQPVYDYIGDSNAVDVLWGELPPPRFIEESADGRIDIAWGNCLVGLETQKPRRVAIALAWLKWRGIEVEVCDANDN